MKYAYLLILVLAMSASPVCGRDIVVHYYPTDPSPEKLVIAFSPDGFEPNPNSNPTFAVEPNTTLRVGMRPGARVWWWTPGHGWKFGPAADDPEREYDFHLLYSNPTGHFHYRIPAVQPSTGGSALPPLADAMPIFWLGFTMQITFELAGMLIRFLRAMRASGSVDMSG